MSHFVKCLKNKLMRYNLRNVCGWLFANILIACGLVRVATNRAKKGEFILSIFFHKPSEKEFESCVKWLIKKKFNFLSPADIENIIRLDLPFPKNAVVLTADDGWFCNEANIGSIANKYKVPVTIFVSTAPVLEGVYWWTYIIEAKKKGLSCPSLRTLKKMPDSERVKEVEKIKKMLSLDRNAMTVRQVNKLATSEYVTIGAHTHSHPILINCPDTQLYFELEFSRTNLESWIGKEVSYFSYPNGDFGMREIQALKDLKYKIAFCSNPCFLTPDTLLNNYSLPRFSFLEGASFAENVCRMVGVWHPLMRKVKSLLVFKANKEIKQTVYQDVEEELISQ
jgi:poly-beta-1,6-N-acetyl-D-glucosamine N-deacetylase